MEYREYYCGDMTIPEEKRGEFTQRVLTIMDHLIDGPDQRFPLRRRTLRIAPVSTCILRVQGIPGCIKVQQPVPVKPAEPFLYGFHSGFLLKKML